LFKEDSLAHNAQLFWKANGANPGLNFHLHFIFFSSKTLAGNAGPSCAKADQR